MEQLKLKILNEQGHTLMASAQGQAASLVYPNAYQQGDRIALEVSTSGLYCMVQFEDSLPAALVYVAARESNYYIPFGQNRVVFSPKSFGGERHLIRARVATAAEIAQHRNLAFNPFDQHGQNGFYPHAQANVETRGEAVFAAYNAIDGVYENASHGEWPYQSWGINRDPNAEWTLFFGRQVLVDQLRLTLRADFPHDNYWTQATVAFSDGTEETIQLTKTADPQAFAIAPRRVEWLVLKQLIQAQGESPFPALTQFEAWGTETPKQ